MYRNEKKRFREVSFIRQITKVDGISGKYPKLLNLPCLAGNYAILHTLKMCCAFNEARQ